MSIGCDVDVVRSNGVVFVELSGELDEACLGVLLPLAGDLAIRSRHLILDLAGVTFIDSGGVHALVQLEQRCLSFRLVNPGDHVRAVLRLTGLDGYITEDEV